MFYKQWESSMVPDARTITRKCLNCKNESEHVLCVEHKFGIGLIFIKDPLFSFKKYYLVCPVCTRASEELSKEQADALRK